MKYDAIMGTIFFCDNLDALRNWQKKKPQDIVQYLIFGHNKRTERVIEFVGRNKDFVEIDSNLVNDFREKFSEKFISFIADLNKANQSLLWWALNFTNKNPISTPLCDEVFQVLSIVHLIQNKSIENLLVITDDIHVVKQFLHYADRHNVRVVNGLPIKANTKEIVMKYTPVGVVYAFLRMLFCTICAKVFSPRTIYEKKKYSVLFSILSSKSFDKNGRYFDVYFGKFLDYLREIKRDFISIVIVRPSEYVKLLKKIWSRSFCHSGRGSYYCGQGNLYIFPVEYFLTFKDLLTCLWHGLVKYFSPIQMSGSVLIDDVDFSYLVKKNIRKDYQMPFFFDNLRIYYFIKSLTKRISLDKFFYPFENRPFEKMIILALRDTSNVDIIGYQHASISLRHTNFLLAEGESEFTPLPDSIITMGEETKNILERYGRFPMSLLKTGCALRQISFRGELKPKKDRIKNIFVALATNIEEYVKVVRFLNEAFEGNDFYNIWIRPHPVFSLEDALKITGHAKFKFHKADKESIDECHAWADVVLYVHSTLAIEAIARGIPVINLAIENPLNPDPLFNFEDFKWVACEAESLVKMVSEIDSLNDEDFFHFQENGAWYARRYFSAATDEVLGRFIA